MAGTCVLELEGVLCKGSPPNDPPVWTGLQMYHALATQFRLVIDSEHDDITEIEHWLMTNGLKRHSLVLLREAHQDGLEAPLLRKIHLGEWRAQGFDVALYVTADPAVAKAMMTAGVTTLLMAHPAYARPEHRPDYEGGLKPWAEIEEEINATALKRESVPRIDAEMDFDES